MLSQFSNSNDKVEASATLFPIPSVHAARCNHSLNYWSARVWTGLDSTVRKRNAGTFVCFGSPSQVFIYSCVGESGDLFLCVKSMAFFSLSPSQHYCHLSNMLLHAMPAFTGLCARRLFGSVGYIALSIMMFGIYFHFIHTVI